MSSKQRSAYRLSGHGLTFLRWVPRSGDLLHLPAPGASSSAPGASRMSPESSMGYGWQAHGFGSTWAAMASASHERLSNRLPSSDADVK